jgi:SAM-dependent methyltransferase
MVEEAPGGSGETDPTRAHYATLLAPIYRWMLGDWEQALSRSRAELHALGVRAAGPDARALDLGAGPGLQSIPLAELGYRVTAVDTSGELLAALSAARPDVRAVLADLADLGSIADEVDDKAYGETSDDAYDLIVCMGDTLTHLHTEGDVRRVLAAACRRLRPGGRVVLTFRDYVALVRESTDRFILVHGDAERVLTCCLEEASARVRVTDLVHERRDGRWTLRASAYHKLRLSAAYVREALCELGLEIDRCDSAGGRISVVGTKISCLR